MSSSSGCVKRGNNVLRRKWRVRTSLCSRPVTMNGSARTVTVGGGLETRNYALDYLEAAERLLRAEDLKPVALPIFFLLRQAMELAMKAVLELAANNRRDEEVLRAFRAAGRETATAVAAKELASCSRHPVAFSSHKLNVLLDALRHEQIELSAEAKQAVTLIVGFEGEQFDRSRFPTPRDRKSRSLPGFMERGVELQLGQIGASVRTAIVELVGNHELSALRGLDADSQSLAHELYEHDLL